MIKSHNALRLQVLNQPLNCHCQQQEHVKCLYLSRFGVFYRNSQGHAHWVARSLARDNSHEMKLSMSRFTLYKKDKVLDTNNLGRGENSNWLTGLIFIHNWLPDFKAGNTSHWISMHPAEVLG